MDNKFVMLGERSNGRIAKNEHYTVDDFIDKVKEDHKVATVSMKIGILDILFKKRMELKLARIHDGAYWSGYNSAYTTIKHRIHQLIDTDNFGKKKK